MMVVKNFIQIFRTFTLELLQMIHALAIWQPVGRSHITDIDKTAIWF
uniref:Uncharacterized protein n=1 Tax=Arundo donax TaxID=35708 RepID=A0A0A8YM35_ARUDO